MNSRALIAETARETRDALAAAIVVSLSADADFVFLADRTTRKELDSLIARGGRPIGVLAFVEVDGRARATWHAFAEYAGEPWIDDYLESLLEGFRATAAALAGCS